jgi:hypothetical protein
MINFNMIQLEGPIYPDELFSFYLPYDPIMENRHVQKRKINKTKCNLLSKPFFVSFPIESRFDIKLRVNRSFYVMICDAMKIHEYPIFFNNKFINMLPGGYWDSMNDNLCYSLS